jgi:nucleoside-diphosphate-sugar epimerase
MNNMASVSNTHAPRALITGINGFTGQYLSRELENAGYQVFGLTNSKVPDSPNVFACDLEDKEKLAHIVAQVSPQVVAHLAAVSFVAHDDVDAIYRTNLLGTRNLLQALDKASVKLKKVLLASSANIYGNATKLPITENCQPNPENDYAVSKMAMEAMAKLWMDRLPIVVVRPFNYTGVGQTRNFLIPKIVDHFKHRETTIELGNIDVERDFSDVRDIVWIYHKLLKNSISGETYNICSGNSKSLKEIISHLSEIAGYEIKIKVNPDFVRNNEIKKLVGSDEKLRATIGDIERIPIKETLSWMYNAKD